MAREVNEIARGPHRISHLVYVEGLQGYRQTGPAEFRPVGETEFAVREASRLRDLGGPQVGAVVSFADLGLGAAVQAVLDDHERAGSGLLRGIRYSTAWDPSPDVPNAHSDPRPGVLVTPPVTAGLERLADAGLVFDAWMYHHQLGELVDVARRFESLTVVLNHFGTPLAVGPYEGQTESVSQTWRSHMAVLASCPNVYVKLGGLGMAGLVGAVNGDAAGRVTSDMLANHWAGPLEWCINQFGPERCMFESNFPIDGRFLDYTVIWNCFQKIANQYSPNERKALFSGTAMEVYQIDDDR